MSDWGKAAKNNSIGFGQGSVNNNINWGKSQKDSSVAKNWAGETNISGSSSTPSPPPSGDLFSLKLKFDVVSGVEKTISIGRIAKPDTDPVTIDWGDGQTQQLTNYIPEPLTHTYNSGNTGSTQNPIVSFGKKDDLGRLSSFEYLINNDPYNIIKDQDLLSIEQWGQVDWNILKFNHSANMQLNAIDKPNIGSAYEMFDGCTAFTGNESMKDWDMSNVGQCFRMFRDCINFNVSALNWDMSNCFNLDYMFYCSHPTSGIFNGRLDNWDFSNCSRLTEMLTNQKFFNNDSVNSWNVSNVSSLYRVFKGCTSFNQDLNNWDISSATSLRRLFEEATAMNGNISNWDTRNLTSINGLFMKSGFNTSNAGFNTHANNIYWNTSNVDDMGLAFNNMQSDIPSISNWDTSKVRNFGAFALSSTNFNQDVENWDVSKTQFTNSMFNDAKLFDKDLSSWDMSKVINCSRMFVNSDVSFDPSTWVLTEAVDLHRMFMSCSQWNHNISNMVLGPNITKMDYMFYNSGMTSINYTDTVVGWAVQVYVMSAPNNVNAFYLANPNSGIGILTTRTDDDASGLSYVEKYGIYGPFTGGGWTNAGDALEYLTTSTEEGGAGWTI
jgi:surface protein